MAISYFLCLIEDPKFKFDACHNESAVAKEVTMSFTITKPNIAVVHDQHWASNGRLKSELLMKVENDFERTLALNMMLHDAVLNNVNSMFYLTMSLTENEESYFWIEMTTLMKAVDILGCSKNSENNILFSVVNWAYLTCPSIFETGKCSRKAHGFDDILPDGTHPLGKAGEWLTDTTLSVIMAEYSLRIIENENHGNYSTWENALKNPYTAKLLDFSPLPETPHLNHLVTSYYLCPFHDLELLNQTFFTREFHDYLSYSDSPYLLK
jgi:hypothetical protein